MALTLAGPPESRNVDMLRQWRQEEFTGITTAVIPLSQAVDTASGIVLVWKNGTLLRPSLNVTSGSTLTLPSALIAGDWVTVLYKARL